MLVFEKGICLYKKQIASGGKSYSKNSTYTSMYISLGSTWKSRGGSSGGVISTKRQLLVMMLLRVMILREKWLLLLSSRLSLLCSFSWSSFSSKRNINSLHAAVHLFLVDCFLGTFYVSFMVYWLYLFPYQFTLSWSFFFNWFTSYKIWNLFPGLRHPFKSIFLEKQINA